MKAGNSLNRDIHAHHKPMDDLERKKQLKELKIK
ncbi:unnamed protein product, partial [marine sediment metagenome]